MPASRYQLRQNNNGTLLENLRFGTKKTMGIDRLWWRPQSYGTGNGFYWQK